MLAPNTVDAYKVLNVSSAWFFYEYLTAIMRVNMRTISKAGYIRLTRRE